MSRRLRPSTKWHFSRLDFIRLAFFVVGSLFILKLFFIQVVNHADYKAMAQKQHWTVYSIPAKRGDIISRDGHVLAGTQTSYYLFAEPKKILSPDKVADVVASALGETSQKRITDLLRLDLFWVILAKNITPEQKAAIEELALEGIGFEETPKRYYPNGTLAAHILGFVANDAQGAAQGYYGVEGELDGELKGKDGRVIQEKDATGDPILIGGYEKVAPINGRNITLTIDRAVQYLVEKKLKEGVEMYKAYSGSVIVMDPKTSEVLAMANYPTYEPANFSEETKEVNGETIRLERRNAAISENYEPGSVIKPLTVAAALDLDKVKPNSTFEDNGPVKYSDYTIDNWDGKHHGTQTVIQLLQKSNNIGAAWVGHLVGAKNLAEYFSKFGLGAKTGIELEGEDAGIVRDYKNWTAIDLATASFGQGLSATPLQVLNAFNVFANEGYLYQPKIIHAITEEGKTTYVPPRRVQKVLAKDTAAAMLELLTAAVEGGESKYFNIENYKVAGKTGTAQIPKDGKYDPSKTNATFVGFLPESLRFSMIVRLDQPTSSVYASETAVPLWMSIAKDLINYYGIAPDK